MPPPGLRPSHAHAPICRARFCSRSCKRANRLRDYSPPTAMAEMGGVWSMSALIRLQIASSNWRSSPSSRPARNARSHTASSGQGMSGRIRQERTKSRMAHTMRLFLWKRDAFACDSAFMHGAARAPASANQSTRTRMTFSTFSMAAITSSEGCVSTSRML